MKATSDIDLFYEQHHKSLHRLALRLLCDEEEAHDAVSDVFAQLLEPSLAIRGDVAAYLHAAVRNRCLNLLRHKRLSERLHRLLPVGEDLTEEQQTNEQEDILEAMLQFVNTALTPQTREVVRLRFQSQMTYRQISEHLGISEAAVYKHLAQAIRKLKARFNP